MTRRPLVYVAGPYTTPEPVGMNVKRAVEVGSRMLDAGLAPIVPHLSHYWHDGMVDCPHCGICFEPEQGVPVD